jgi:hypothetical protein
MGSLLAELVPFVVGLAITPAAITVTILLLGSKRPVANASCFAVAFAIVYGIVSIVVLAVSGTRSKPLISSGTKAVITLCVGLVLLLFAILTEVRHRRAEVLPADAPARRTGLLATINTATPAKAFSLGLILAVLNPNIPILLAGLATIAAAPVSLAGRAVGAVLLVAGAELGLLGPLGWYLLRPATATTMLERAKGWLARHEHALDLAVLIIFGAIFTIKGAVGL